MGWAIAVHGGAGDVPVDLPLEKREPQEATLRHCLDIGIAALKHGRPPLDVIELVVIYQVSHHFLLHVFLLFINLLLLDRIFRVEPALANWFLSWGQATVICF